VNVDAFVEEMLRINIAIRYVAVVDNEYNLLASSQRPVPLHSRQRRVIATSCPSFHPSSWKPWTSFALFWEQWKRSACGTRRRC
jgi:hypothetical protein